MKRKFLGLDTIISFSVPEKRLSAYAYIIYVYITYVQYSVNKYY